MPILLIPLIACYLDIARPFHHHHHAPPPIYVLDVRSESSAYADPTMAELGSLQ